MKCPYGAWFSPDGEALLQALVDGVCGSTEGSPMVIKRPNVCGSFMAHTPKCTKRALSLQGDAFFVPET